MENAGKNCENRDRACACQLCERSYENGGSCPYYNKSQRLPADLSMGGLGLCPKLRSKTSMPDEDGFSLGAGILEDD